MSWRALILFLLVAIVASWQGGRQLGLWLVDQAPESIASASSTTNDRGQVLDADGKPLAPQPPQPRIDGTLGVPREMQPVEWTIAPIIASREDANSYKKDGEEDEEGEGEDRNNQQDRQDNTDTVRTVDVQAATAGSQAARPSASPSATLNWQDALRKELAQCSKVGFFKRPGCIDSAQNKYCEPNNAWGKISDCPDRGSTPNVGG